MHHLLSGTHPSKLEYLPRSPSSSSPQGKLQCWVEMIPAKMVKFHPLIDITPLPPKPFEIRIVVWETKDCPALDPVEKMNDMYITVEIENWCKAQTTDTHWRAQHGKGAFNWRMKFHLDINPREDMYRLRMSAWDKDVVGANDAIGAATMPIHHFLRAAYVNGRCQFFNQVMLCEKACRLHPPACILQYVHTLAPSESQHGHGNHSITEQQEGTREAQRMDPTVSPKEGDRRARASMHHYRGGAAPRCRSGTCWIRPRRSKQQPNLGEAW